MTTPALAQADALALPLATQSVHCIVTSPPYWGLRDYGVAGQLGLEAAHDCAGAFTGTSCGTCYVCHLRAVATGLWRALKEDGTLWLNLGDSYTSGGRVGHGTRVGYKQRTNRGMNGTCDPPRAPHPPGLRDKNLLGIPWRVAFALQHDGWILRSEIIWHKPNGMPESVEDRPTKSHEQVFLLVKQSRYFYDAGAIRDPGKTGWNGSSFTSAQDQATKPNLGQGARTERGGSNARSVWALPTEAYPGTHFATFPRELARRCILAGCPSLGIVLDPFCGSGTVPLMARALGRKGIGLDLSGDYLHKQARPRLLANGSLL